MGFTIAFNWVLQIDPPASLKVRSSYSFEKPGNRVFPLNTPIDLIDSERAAIAKIAINSFTNKEHQTTGEFEVLKIYTDPEKAMLTKYWMENQ